MQKESLSANAERDSKEVAELPALHNVLVVAVHGAVVIGRTERIVRIAKVVEQRVSVGSGERPAGVEVRCRHQQVVVLAAGGIEAGNIAFQPLDIIDRHSAVAVDIALLDRTVARINDVVLAVFRGAVHGTVADSVVDVPLHLVGELIELSCLNAAALSGDEIDALTPEQLQEKVKTVT